MPPKDQGELPGIRPGHIKRLEDIEDDMESIDEKVAKLRKQKRELNDEAVQIYEEHKLTGTRVRGSNEWYVDEPAKKYKRRRFKDSKEEAGKKPAAKKAEKATA